MQPCQLTAGYLLLSLLLLWQPRRASLTQGMQQRSLDPPLGPGPGQLPPSREDKSTADLVAKMLLLNELVSLENDVFETKKKRSFPGFGSPLDRLSKGLKTKQRKVRPRPKKWFGLPLDRIGGNRLRSPKA
ncbi:osteocrin [Erythrolamprus reginae]|uniref:osteocrin n=1 Tax=Erythrolamprus reginae TaxID=121349 RepID=UPI00396CB87F